MTGDLAELRHALIANWTRLLLELLGTPSRKGARQWRWNRRGSLSAVIAGPKAGRWFDHEAGTGGGPFEIIIRERGGDWRSAADWARGWLGLASLLPDRRPPALPPPANDLQPDPAVTRRLQAQRSAEATWRHAVPADVHHPYLQRKGVGTHGLRQDHGANLIIPLVDLDGTIHTIQRISEDGDKRYLPGGAKAEHFAVIGGPLGGAATILLCEGWATGATAHEATGSTGVAAMDAGNVIRVAPLLRARFPDTVLIILADNDTKPDRDTNPGVTAATAAARAANALMAIPPEPGDMNDLAASRGLAAVAACIATAAPIPPIPPTYPLPTLSPEAARAQLDSIVGNFMTDVAAYWSGTAASPYEDDAVLPDMAAMAATPAPAGHAWI